MAKADARVMKLKETVSADVLANFKLGQEMVDSVFSFGELGFQGSRPSATSRAS